MFWTQICHVTKQCLKVLISLLSVCLFVCLSVCVSVCMSVCVSVCMSVKLVHASIYIGVNDFENISLFIEPTFMYLFASRPLCYVILLLVSFLFNRYYTIPLKLMRITSPLWVLLTFVTLLLCVLSSLLVVAV